MSIIVTPSFIAATGLAGSNGLGPISVPGAKVGDRVLTCFLTRSSSVGQEAPGTFIEYVVTVDDEVQQLDPSNLSSAVVDLFLVRLP